MEKQSENSADVFYEKVKAEFSEEAVSLLTAEEIAQTLAGEKRRFENAAGLAISPNKVTENNTARYCKDLLRSRQPLPFLYTAISFLAEVSVWLFGCGICLWLAHLCLETSPAVPFYCPVLLSVGLVSYRMITHRYLLKQLGQAIAKAEAARVKKRLVRVRAVVAGAAILAVLCVGALLFQNQQCRNFYAPVSYYFLIYVAGMLLSGAHNVLYSGHALAFFRLAFFLVTGQARERDSALEQYIAARCAQMMAQSHKTAEDFKTEGALEGKLREALYAHMNTQRVYYLLAFLICAGIAIALGVTQLHNPLSVWLIVLCVLSLLLAVVLYAAFYTAHYVAKELLKNNF